MTNSKSDFDTIIGQWEELEDSPRETEDYYHREYRRTNNHDIRKHAIRIGEEQFYFNMLSEPERDQLIETVPEDAPEDDPLAVRRWHILIDADEETIKPDGYINTWDGLAVSNPSCPPGLKKALELATGYDIIDPP